MIVSLNILSTIKFEYLIILIFGILIISFIVFFLFLKKVKTGIALIRSVFGRTRIAFNKDIIVIPRLYKSELINITTKKSSLTSKEINH